MLSTSGTSRPSAAASMGAVSGSARTTDGHAIANARVEVRNTFSGAVVASGYTSVNGSFEFHGLPSGTYDIVVVNGLDQGTDRQTVNSETVFVTIRMSNNTSDSNAGTADMVSVAELKVPGKARDECKKAQAALAKGKPEESWKHVAKALTIFPDYAQALTIRALLEMDEHKATEATADLERAVELDRGYSLSFLVLGSAYNLASRFDDALRVLDHGVALAPNSWQGYFEMAKAYVGKLNYPSALHQLDKAASVAPNDYPPIHLVRANVYLAIKNYPEAMNELESYLERDPSSPTSAAARKTLDQVKAFVAKK